MTSNTPVLLAYDASDGAKRAIAIAGELLGPRRALVLHVWESWGAEAPALAGPSATVAASAGFDAEGLSEEASGPIWKTILDAADRNQCAAIVVGSRGLTGISAALGSVSNGVVHHSHRPVLVVPDEEER
jgi:nucleotide-binding universal stress UspA family protein